MTTETFIEIMNDESIEADINNVDDNAWEGLKILSKYAKNLIQGAGHDVIWGPNIEDLVENGITEDDVRELRKLNWMIEDESYVACFV